MTAPLFNDETERLEALWRFDILDTAPEQAFDDLTRLAAQTCGTPIALVTLADESRHWAKSTTGTVPREMPRDIAFSEYAIHESGPLVVPDARADARFAAHPLVVSEPYVRFYAGVPLRTPEGLVLGTLCVMDTVSRELTQSQTDGLLMLGRQVVAQMQLRLYASAREQDALRAREALREESALRDLFMESATGAMVAFDLERRFTLVNRRMCDITGRSEADLIGRPFASLQSPEAIARLAGTFGRIITERTPAEGLETELLRPDGATISIAFNAAPIVRDGVVVGVAATATDITERKRAQALLEAQRRILEMILSDRSLDQVLMAVAVAVEQLAGTQCAVLLTDERGATLACVAIPTLPESFAAAIDGIAIGPVAASCGTAAFRKAPVMTRDIDADPLWRDYRELAAGHGLRAAWSTPILSPEGPVLGTLALYTREPRLPDEWQARVIETATALAALAIQRTRAQKQIVDSEARYRLLWETSVDALIALDEHGRVLFANSALLDVFGYTPEEVIGHDLTVLQPERLHEAHREGFRRYVATGEKRLDWRAALAVGRHKDGHEFPIEISFSDMCVGGTRQFAGLIRDITERSRTEETLRESEARYRALAENAFDLVCELDSAGRFAYASPNFESVLGYSPPELIGRVAFELIHPGDQERVVQEYAGAIADPASGTITFRFQRSDTRWAWLEVSANIYRNEAGESRAVIVSRDIGERMAMEATLRDSETRLRSFVEHAPVMLFATDREGVVTLCEGKGLELVGLLPGQNVGASLFEVYARLPAIIEGSRRTLSGETVTYMVPLGDLTLEVHQSPVRDAAGEIVGSIGLTIDASERLRAVSALRDSEERYRAIFETHRAVRLLIDPATGLIEEANEAACEFYGYSTEELAGKPVSEINTLTPEEILDEMRRARDDNQTLFQFKHRLKSGEIRNVDVYTGPVEVDGRTLLFSIVQDVTDRRRAESLVTSQGQLLEMIAVGAPIEAVLQTLATTVEEHAPGALCSVLLLSPDGKRLLHAAAPGLPDAYNQAIDGIEVGPDVGSCGTAAYRREEIVVEDIAVDPLWKNFRDLALSHELRSCWSTPIFSGTGEVLGTFAVYYRTPGGVRGGDRALVGMATHVAGIAIERERAEKAMQGRTGELERMYERLAEANTELETSNTRIEEKSALLERALELERERSRRDQLTGTLNHAAITDALREVIDEANADTLAIAMVDVDGLKAANDTYGHQVGDAVLALVARHLMRNGAVVGRYGGDEFVSILRGADQQTAEAYRENVLASLAGAMLTDLQTGARVPVVVSIGLAMFPEEGESADDLIRLADSAMYASRRQGVAGGNGALSRTPDGARAAELVGELVPYLTSPGDLEQKLRLVSQRLSTGNGYDAVTFAMFDEVPGGPARANVYADTARDITDAWTDDQRSESEPHPVRLLLDRTHRPVIIDDVQTSDLITPLQKQLLAAAGLTSGLVAPMIWHGQVVGMLSVGSKQPAAFGPRDAQFLLTIASQVTAIVRMSTLVDELQTSTSRLREAHEGTVLMLASAAEAHDHTTGRHLQRVRAITEALARELGYNDDDVSALGMAATLHDIGKIRVPDSVLGSSNSLAETEWILMKQHTLWGSAFLAGQPGFELAASVARHHHERWDGGGYPDGLAGDDIPESALITTIADSFDAMTNNRPYRRSRPVGEAVREIVACSGTQFSPRIVDALVRLFERGDLDFVRPDEDELHLAA